ncbi:SGNH/GDSL hydrolase family protein [Geofilum rhodophaeum]|uniref:SGNH/GDSL hydrolase family protein n=1 Tax=Geofilum rhodophaeum TaxID=1965019 RepID=UPI000B523630|nr:SGNH/GDSL hydrolase family protein [Geofilum rhodophaeum]
MKMFKISAALLLALGFWQCEISVDEFEASSGSLDLSSYVALGDSYSAGYVDGALGRETQVESLPAILAQQFALAGGGAFTQPLMPEGKSIGGTAIDEQGTLNGYFQLQVVNQQLTPVPTVGDMEVFGDIVGDQGPFNNMAVPGAKASHLLTPLFSTPEVGNPYFVRFASNPGQSSVLSDALRAQPTFFSLWIGGNDVLTSAIAGGSEDITPPQEFAAYINLLMEALAAEGRPGVIANIPSIEALPYFSFVGTQLPTAIAVEDPAEEAGLRVLLSGEKVLLPALQLLGAGYGTLEKPLPAQYFLSRDELEAISTAIAAYNEAIAEAAAEHNLALVDMHGMMERLKTGMVVDGNNYSSTFISGQVLSLDGIHATPRGYAIIANEFIRAINAKYQAAIPLVNVNDYRGNVFP